MWPMVPLRPEAVEGCGLWSDKAGGCRGVWPMVTQGRRLWRGGAYFPTEAGSCGVVWREGVLPTVTLRQEA